MDLKNTNDLQKLHNLYIQLCTNVERITNNKTMISEREWNTFFSKESIQIIIEKILDILYDMIIPIEDICKKYYINRKEYLTLYCKDSSEMNIKKRRNLIQSILDRELTIEKLEIIIA